MKNKLKIALILGGMIGTTYGFRTDISESQITDTHTSYQPIPKAALATAPTNILQNKDLSSCSTGASSQKTLPQHVAAGPSLQEKIDAHISLILELETTKQRPQTLKNQLSTFG